MLHNRPYLESEILQMCMILTLILCHLKEINKSVKSCKFEQNISLGVGDMAV